MRPLETTQSPPWWQQTEEAVWRVGGITCNAEGFAGETGAVDVLEGGERDTNNLLSCSHYPLKGLAAGRIAGAIPHSDAASQDALDGASVEGAHDRGRGSGSSEFAEEVETLLCFLGQCCSVVSPGEVLCELYTQELGAAHSLHSRTIDGQRSMLSVHSPEVNNNLLHLLHIQREIVVTAPPRQAAHLTPPQSLLLMRPTTIVSSTNLMKRLELFDGVQSWVSRVKRRGLSTHPWGAPVFSVMVLDVLLPTRTAWGLPESFLSRCVRAGWRAVAMASSVERLDLYANWKGSREGGEARLDVVHD